MTATFDTTQSSSQTIKEVALHGDTALDTPAYRATFMPINKTTTNEVRVDVLMEVRCMSAFDKAWAMVKDMTTATRSADLWVMND